MRKLRVLAVLLLVGLVALLGCAPKATPAPTPTLAPATPTPGATPGVTPATPAPGATPAPTPGPAPAKPAWQVEWEKTLDEAKKEGKVTIYGPPGAEVRRFFIEEFSKAYPSITVEFTGATGSQVAPKIEAERRGGLFLPDLHIGGTTTIVTVLKKYALPIEQFLILPEVKDGKNWVGGKLKFADKEDKYNLVFTNYVSGVLAYNPNLLDPKKAAELSLWDLTKPEWKGKVLMTDGRVAGPGLAKASFIYANPKLGPDFLRALAKNDVVLGRDQRQMAEWVGRGKYTVLIGPDHGQAAELMKAGLPLKEQNTVKEGAPVSADYGSIIFLDRVPHPNAARVYLNWLLTKEAQAGWVKASGDAWPSLRVDVSREKIDPDLVPKEGVSYFLEYREESQEFKEPVRQLLVEIFGK